MARKNGNSGNNKINGTAKNDIINGLDGNDTLLGGNGNDKLFGGNGDDQLNGGNGKDTMEGMDGNDTIIGGEGNDILDGGNGNDVIIGGKGNNDISGGKGDNTIYIENSTGNLHLDGNDRIIFSFDSDIDEDIYLLVVNANENSKVKLDFSNIAELEYVENIDAPNQLVIGTFQDTKVPTLYVNLDYDYSDAEIIVILTGAGDISLVGVN